MSPAPSRPPATRDVLVRAAQPGEGAKIASLWRELWDLHEAWGGYAGLALRMGAAQKAWRYGTGDSDKRGDDLNGITARWVDASGPTGGVLFLDHPANPRHPTPWRVSPQMPYLSPSPLYGSALELASGEKLDFHYRLWMHAKTLTPAECRAEWESFSAAP